MTFMTSMFLAGSAGLLPADRAPPAESLHVVASGSGPTVVYIPGLFGSAFGFRHVEPLLVEAGYRVVVIEPLGVGSSSRPAKANYSLTAQADRIALVVDTLGAGPVLVVAHSLGGAIAFRLIVRRPDLVRGFLSIEGGPSEEATTTSFRRAIRWAPLLKIFGGAKTVRAKAREMLTESSGDPSWITDDVVNGYTAGATRSLGATIHAYELMGHSRERERLAPRIPEIQCPVRLMIGAAPHTGGVGDSEMALMRQSLASFAIDSVPGAGHYIQEEQPAAVLESLRRLDARLDGKTARRQDGRPPRS